MQKLCIVIPALNEENLLQKTLESLDEQNNLKFSVIVVDNGSTDGTCQVVISYAEKAKYELIVIREDKKGVGYARTTGTNEAIKLGALYIGGTDADTTFPDSWIESIYNGFEKGNSELLCGECHPLKYHSFDSEKANFSLSARSFLFHRVKPFFRGANYAVTKDMYLKVGEISQPLTKDSKPAPGEDGELEKAVFANGGSLDACLEPVYPHPRRYIQNLQKITEFVGLVHEGGVVTQVRDEDTLEKYLKTVPTETIDIFVDKVSHNIFSQEVLGIYREPLFKSRYWEKALKLLEPFNRQEIEKDLENESDDYITGKYMEVFFENIKSKM